MVADQISKEKTGKTILNEADKYALIEGWQPTDANEVTEFNRYNKAWRTACFAELDAQTIYLQAKVKYQAMLIEKYQDKEGHATKETFLVLRTDFIKNYELLLGFQSFFKRLSKTYNMDLLYRVDLLITECKKMTESFNKDFPTELQIDMEKIKPNGERAEPAVKELSELLGDDFNE